MANFDFFNSRARKKILAQKQFGKVFVVLSLVNAAIFLWAIYYLVSGDSFFQGVGEIMLGAILLLQGIYLAKRYAGISIGATGNIADQFSPALTELLEMIFLAAKKENIAAISPEYIFHRLYLVDEGKIIFIRLGLPFNPLELQKAQTKPQFSHEAIKLFESLTPKNPIEIEDVLEAIVRASKAVQDYLANYNLKEQDWRVVLDWLKRAKKASVKPKLWDDAGMVAGVGQDWSYGYTPVLSMFSTDLSQYFQDPRLQIAIFGHANKIDDIQTVLARSGKNNVLLSGEPGVGKKTIVNALAMKLARGDCLAPLKYKRIRQLDIGRLLAGANQGELEGRLEGALSDATHAGNIIIFIDNFQSLLGGGTSSGREVVGGIDATEILIPFLQNSDLRIIASVSPEDYFDRVRANSAVSGAFEKIDVLEATPEDTVAILLESLGYVEYKYHIFFPYQTLKKIVELSSRYIHEVPFPEKSLRLLEEAGINPSGGEASGKVKIITPADVEAIVSKKANIPIGQVAEKEKDKLLNLEQFLHKRVIGQDEAITAVADALRRVRSGLATGKRPVGVFLFLGPTGVGKTETAKALAENYFGSEEKMIRLDMSEYQEPNSVDRLIGTINNPSGILTDAILANPFSLILLDEIEKAEKSILNLFLQVFEDGRLTDPRGRVSDFTNAIIIATSNAGSEFIREAVTAGKTENIKSELVNKLQSDGIFTPEFLNRFDDIVTYKPLTETELQQVAQLMIGVVNKTLEEKKIQVTVAPDALAKLVHLGYDPQFGARPMRRVIQEKVENLLAKKLLSGEVKENQTYQITMADIST